MHSTVKDEKKRKIVFNAGEHHEPSKIVEATPEESAAFLKACDTGKSDPAADLIRLNDLAAHVEELQTEIAQKDDEIARMKRETVSPETELLIREEIDRCAGLFADLQQALDKMATEKVATHLQNVRLRDKLSRVQPQLDTLAGKVVEKTHELKKVRRKSDRLKEALDVERDRVRTLTHHIDELEREVDTNAVGPIFDQVHVQTLEKENARLRELVNESTPQRITQLENEIVQLREDENAALAENRKLHEQLADPKVPPVFQERIDELQENYQKVVAANERQAEMIRSFREKPATDSESLNHFQERIDKLTALVEVGDRTLATLMNERDELLGKINELDSYVTNLETQLSISSENR